MFDTACWNKPDWRVCVDKHWPEERMLARTGRRNQEMRGGSELGPQFAQASLSMTKGHSSRTTTRVGRGDTVVNVMRLACLRRISFTTLHISARCISGAADRRNPAFCGWACRGAHRVRRRQPRRIEETRVK